MDSIAFVDARTTNEPPAGSSTTQVPVGSLHERHWPVATQPVIHVGPLNASPEVPIALRGVHECPIECRQVRHAWSVLGDIVDGLETQAIADKGNRPVTRYTQSIQRTPTGFRVPVEVFRILIVADRQDLDAFSVEVRPNFIRIVACLGPVFAGGPRPGPSNITSIGRQGGCSRMASRATTAQPRVVRPAMMPIRPVRWIR